MKNFFTFRNFTLKLFLLVTFLTMTSFGIFNALKKAADVVTAPVTFISGMTLGKVVEGATASTMDKYSSLIANYETANANSINKLDTALQHRISQFDVTLHNSAAQFDEILKTSAKQIDLGVKDNIGRIDDALKERIGGLNTGLTRTSFILTSGLWRIVKGTVQLIIFILLLYFTFVIILRVNTHGGINAAESKEIIKRTKPFLIITLVALLIVSLFNPVTSKFTNPDYTKLIKSYQGELETYAKSYDYKKASYVSYLLSELDYDNSYYKYQQAKYNLLKNISYRSKYAIFNPQNRSEFKTMYLDFINFYEQSKIKDPEFSTINGLINQSSFNSTEGDILAALSCYNSLFIERSSININELLSTDVYAANIYKNFFLHPPSRAEIEQVIKQYGITVNQSELDTFLNIPINVDSILYSSSLQAPYFLYDSLVSDLIKSDEAGFISYLNFESTNDTMNMRKVGNSMIDKWMNFTNSSSLELFDIDRIRFYSLSLNDNIIQYVITTSEKNKIPFSEAFNKYSSEIKESFKTSLNENNKNDTTTITVFKKAIGIKLLPYFQEKPQQFIISMLAVKKNEREIISEFASSYIKMKSVNTTNVDESSFDVFSKCITDASKLGIYSYEQTPNRPLTDNLLSIMSSTLKPFEAVNANKYNYADLKKVINQNIKFSIYNRISFL